MATTPKPGLTDTALLQQIEKHLAELVVLSKKQLKTLRDMAETSPRR
jgi:hypothetical protein